MKHQRIFLISLGLVLLSCLIFILSRGACVGLLASVFLISLASRRLRIFFAFFAGSLLIGIAIYFLLTHKTFAFTLASGKDPARLLIWPIAVAMIRDRPFFGHGPGSFTKIFYKYSTSYAQGDAPYAHNSFLHMGSEFGMIATVLFIVFLIMVLKRGLRAFNERRDFFLLGMCAAIFGFTIHAFFDNHFFTLQLSSLFWLFSGLLIAYSRSKPAGKAVAAERGSSSDARAASVKGKARSRAAVEADKNWKYA